MALFLDLKHPAESSALSPWALLRVVDLELRDMSLTASNRGAS